MLQHHTFKAAFLMLLATLVFISNVFIGDAKSWADIDWVDVVGEGGSALAMALWVIMIWRSRPLGRVTNLLSLGLGFMMLAFFQDALDEFIRLPREQWWDHGVESIAMPLGIALLTYGLFHWHKEQMAINLQLRKREQFFREHLATDSLTHLGRIDFLKNQLMRMERIYPHQTCSLIILDVADFSSFNRQFGTKEGDRYLHALSELLILNVRKHDLVCRYAGDRFAIVLPSTHEAKAMEMAKELSNAVQYFAFKLDESHASVFQRVYTGIASGEQGGALIEQANAALMRKKPMLGVA